MFRSAPAALAVLALATAAAAAPAPLSGAYGPLLLTVRGDAVSGAYAEQRGGNGSDDAPQFTCAFLLRGSLKTGAIVTWTPGSHETVRGRLTLTPRGVTLKLDADQDGCAMASGPMTGPPFESGQDQAATGWTGAGVVLARRAVLRPAPGVRAARPYVVAWDAVAVLERRPGWVRVAYGAGPRAPTGWVAASEVATDIPARP